MFLFLNPLNLNHLVFTVFEMYGTVIWGIYTIPAVTSYYVAEALKKEAPTIIGIASVKNQNREINEVG
jgi:hypothetical protein